MSAIVATAVNINGSFESHVFTWTGITNADTAVSVGSAENADRTVQMEGVFGSATVAIQGSLDNVNFETLHDAFGNLLTFTGPGIKTISEATPYIKPVPSGGDGTQSLKAMIFAKRGR